MPTAMGYVKLIHKSERYRAPMWLRELRGDTDARRATRAQARQESIVRHQYYLSQKMPWLKRAAENRQIAEAQKLKEQQTVSKEQSYFKRAKNWVLDITKKFNRKVGQ